MPVNIQQISLDQRTQKRNKDYDVPPFVCYDGENIIGKKKHIPIRCWTGTGMNIYAGGGLLQIRGYSECLDQAGMLALVKVMQMAYNYNFPDEENR